MSFFRRSKTTESAGDAREFLIVGLGNPGEKYSFTRHNAGFLCLDLLAQRHECSVKKLRFRALTGDVCLAGHRCLLLKPQTFMNNSGEAVREAMHFYKIPPEKTILLFDDISLPTGRLRIRRSGSDGGQKGVRSIILLTGSDAYPRIKIGVGEKPTPDWDLADWVLSPFTKQELQTMRTACDAACDALELMVCGETDAAMGKYN